MAERVVVALEPIQIEHQQRKNPVALAFAAHQTGEHVVERTSVGEAGQTVGGGIAAQPLGDPALAFELVQQDRDPSDQPGYRAAGEYRHQRKRHGFPQIEPLLQRHRAHQHGHDA